MLIVWIWKDPSTVVRRLLEARTASSWQTVKTFPPFDTRHTDNLTMDAHTLTPHTHTSAHSDEHTQKYINFVIFQKEKEASTAVTEVLCQGLLN